MEAHHYTLLIYDPEKLERTLYHYRFFLERFGYPSFTSLKRFFIHLRYRFCTGFPHEIGIVLGIRPKDVLGFLGLNELPLTLSGSWKVYGDHAREKDLFREIHSIQQRIRWGLDEGNDVETLIHIFSQ